MIKLHLLQSLDSFAMKILFFYFSLICSHQIELF